MNAERQFPEFPKLEASWQPVYIEPITYSGERICIAIAAQSESAGHAVSISLSEEALKCAFGKQGNALLATATLVVNHLESYLKSHKTTEGWEAPVSRIFLGKPVPAAADDLTGIIRQGMERSASFSAMLPVTTEEIEEAAGAKGIDRDRWAKQVRDRVVKCAPVLQKNFNYKFRVRKGARPTTIDFAGGRLAANFGSILPNRLWQTLNLAKAKLLDLEMLRTSQVSFPVSHYELLLFHPEFEDPAYSDRQISSLKEALLEVEDTADKHEIRLVGLQDADSAATRVLEQEAA